MRSLLFLAILVLGASVAVGQSEAAKTMAMTQPWGQAKFTDQGGNVSFRVGAVFAEPDNAAQRLSFTFVCEPGEPAGKLSLFAVHLRVPKSGGASAGIGFQVDGEAARRLEAARQSGNGFSSYTVAKAADAEALAKAMAAGQKLLLKLDEFTYALSLSGFEAKMRDLAGACPHG